MLLRTALAVPLLALPLSPWHGLLVTFGSLQTAAYLLAHVVSWQLTRTFLFWAISSRWRRWRLSLGVLVPEDASWLAELAALQRLPLLKQPQPWPTAGSATHPDGVEGDIVFVVYHKTGTMLSKALAEELDPSFDFLQQSAVGFREKSVVFSCRGLPCGLRFAHTSAPSLFHGDGAPTAGRVHMVSQPPIDWPLPARSRAVHWVRDPVELILSGYRFHLEQANTSWWLETWLRIPGSCLNCDAEAHALAFGRCRYACTYLDLLSTADAATGVALEALTSRTRIELMLQNMHRWSREANVLHLSVEHLRQNFTGTIRCMLTFLGYRGEGLRELARGLQRLDPRRHPGGDIINDATGSPHVLYLRHNNSALRTFLRRHAAWAPRLREAAERLRELFERQAQHHGCPAPA